MGSALAGKVPGVLAGRIAACVTDGGRVEALRERGGFGGGGV